MLKQFDLSTISEIDEGRVLEAWNQACKRLVEDIEDRPGLDDARKLVLTFELKPVKDEAGNLDTINGAFQIKESIPSRKTRNYDFKPKIVNGQSTLAFNPLSEDNANQHTIDEQGGEF